MAHFFCWRWLSGFTLESRFMQGTRTHQYTVRPALRLTCRRGALTHKPHHWHQHAAAAARLTGCSHRDPLLGAPCYRAAGGLRCCHLTHRPSHALPCCGRGCSYLGIRRVRELPAWLVTLLGLGFGAGLLWRERGGAARAWQQLFLHSPSLFLG